MASICRPFSTPPEPWEASKRADTITAAILDGQPARSDVDAAERGCRKVRCPQRPGTITIDDSMLGLKLSWSYCAAARGAQTSIDERTEEAKAVRRTRGEGVQ